MLANSPFDRWRYGGEKGALSQQEQLGYALFTGKAGCSVCHLVGEQSALFTDGQFHDTGLAYSKQWAFTSKISMFGSRRETLRDLAKKTSR